MVGTVYSQTGNQLLDIVQKMKRLLCDDAIKRVTVKGHPLAGINLLARKIVVSILR